MATATEPITHEERKGWDANRFFSPTTGCPIAHAHETEGRTWSLSLFDHNGFEHWPFPIPDQESAVMITETFFSPRSSQYNWHGNSCIHVNGQLFATIVEIDEGSMKFLIEINGDPENSVKVRRFTMAMKVIDTLARLNEAGAMP